MDVKRYGDLQLIDMGKEYLVIACDSSGGIGDKANDQIQLDPILAGYYAAFVPIVECLAVRGQVISLIDTLSVEMFPTGEKIIQGIQRAMLESGGSVQQITGSTEDNIMTSMTGIGVTVIGRVEHCAIKEKNSCYQKQVFLIGKPKVGQELLEEEIVQHKKEIVSLSLMRELIKETWIEQMLPVGSKGIAYEIKVLQERYDGKIVIENKSIDVDKSAGPATCMLITLRKEDIEKIEQLREKVPVTYIGYFEE